MAVYEELEVVLATIQSKLHVHYDSSLTRKNSVLEQFYTVPPPSPSGSRINFNRSNSNQALLTTAAISSTSTTPQSSPPSGSLDASGGFHYMSKSIDESESASENSDDSPQVLSTSPTKRKIKTISFEKPTNVNQFTFVKCAFEKQEDTESAPSGLAQLMKPFEEKLKDPWNAYGDFTPPPNEGITLKIHPGVPGSSFLKVRVIKAATIGQCIAATLKAYLFPPNSTPPSLSPITIKPFSARSDAPSDLPAPLPLASAPPSPAVGAKEIPLDPKQYLFRIADDNGRVDEDYPALDERQQVYKFREECFVLVLRVPTKPPLSSSPGGQNKRRTLSAASLLSPPSSPGQGARVGPDAPATIKVYLPDNTTTKALVQSTVKIGDLLKQICKRRQLSITSHTLHLPGNNSSLDPDMTLDKLNTLELTLSPILAPGPRRRSFTGLAVPFLPSSSTATKSSSAKSGADPNVTTAPTTTEENSDSNDVSSIQL